MNNTILLVEDDVCISEILKLQLEHATPSFVVKVATGLIEAKHFLKDSHVDFVICDLHLADGSGIALIQHMRSNNLAIPTILTSGENGALALHNAGITGVSVVNKPFGANDIIAKIRQLSKPTAASTFVLPKEPITLSVEQVQQIIQQLRTFRHDLNNKMTVLCNASALGANNPDSAIKMIQIIASSLNRPDNLLTGYATVIAEIQKIITPEIVQA